MCERNGVPRFDGSDAQRGTREGSYPGRGSAVGPRPMGGTAREETMRALNIGCGTRRIQGVTNTDHLPSPAVDVVTDIESLPFATGTVDVVFASHVLEHVRDLVVALREIRRVLRPGGFLVAWVPYGWKHAENPFHVRVWTERTVRYLVPSEGNTDCDRLDLAPRWRLRTIRITQRASLWHVRAWLGLDVGKPDEMQFVLEAA